MTATIETPVFNKSVFRHGVPAEERADANSRAPLEQAEREALEARIRVEEAKTALIARQERIDHLTAKRNTVASRLRELERRNLAGQKAVCVATVERLLCSPEVTDPPRAAELNSAVQALAWLPVLETLLPKVVANVKSELAEIEAALVAIHSEK
jgi:hypothetical protein